MFKYWRNISSVGYIIDHSLDMSSIFYISPTSIHYINPFNMNILKMNLKCSTLSRFPSYPLRLESVFPALIGQTHFMKKRGSNDLCDVCLVLSYWLDDCFSQEFHCIFICLWNSIFFLSRKVYLFVLYLLLRGISYVIDIFLDSVWPIDCFWAQFFAMIPTMSHTIPIYRNFQWLNAQTNRIPHIFPFHFIIFFCRFVFSRERESFFCPEVIRRSDSNTVPAFCGVCFWFFLNILSIHFKSIGFLFSLFRPFDFPKLNIEFDIKKREPALKSPIGTVPQHTH